MASNELDEIAVLGHYNVSVLLSLTIDVRIFSIAKAEVPYVHRVEVEPLR